MNGKAILSKVPAVTLGFWIIKILATTLGETGGDTITMSWLGETTSAATGYGYLIGTALVAVPFIALVIVQIAAKKFHPFLYWATIIASTMLGTTLADFADRSLGIGYTGGSAVLLACVLVVLAAWYRSEGTVSVDTVNTPKVEAFYWGAITFSQTLGTALGDWMADDAGVGFLGGALIFGAALAVVAALYFWTEHLACRSVLGGVHSHASSGCHSGRLPGQAVRSRRTQPEPPHRVGSARDCHCGAGSAPAAKGGTAPRPGCHKAV